MITNDLTEGATIDGADCLASLEEGSQFFFRGTHAALWQIADRKLLSGRISVVRWRI